MRGYIRDVEENNSEKLSVDIPVKIHNRYDIEVVNCDGEIKSKAYAENCICEGYWRWLFGLQNNGNPIDMGLFDNKNKLSSSSSVGSEFHNASYGEESNSFFYYLKFGDGVGDPSPNDSDLFHTVGNLRPVEAKFDYVNGNNYIAATTKKYILTETQAVGVDITEVGLFSRVGHIASHARVRDMNGNYITIHKTDTDIINIYATFYADVSSFSPESTDSGIYMYDYEDTLLSVLSGYSEFSAFGKNAGNPTPAMASGYPGENPANQGCLISCGSMTMEPDLQNKKLKLTAPRMTVDNHNTGHGLYGLSLLYWARVSSGYYGSNPRYRNVPGIGLYSGYPWYPGTNITGEPIGTGDGETKDFKTKFPRVTNAKIYINGIETNMATVDLDTPHDPNNMGLIFLPLDNNERAHAKFSQGDGAQYVHPYNNMYACPTSTYWPTSKINYSNSNAISMENVGPLCPTMWYNPRFDLGITEVELQHLHTNDRYRKYQLASSCRVWCKNSKEDEWTELERVSTGDFDAKFTVPEEYKHYKYWKVLGGYFRFKTDAITEYNIHFDQAPNEGDVITADYFTKNIAKDPDHVVDFSMTLTFGEPDKDI